MFAREETIAAALAASSGDGRLIPVREGIVQGAVERRVEAVLGPDQAIFQRRLDGGPVHAGAADEHDLLPAFAPDRRQAFRDKLLARFVARPQKNDRAAGRESVGTNG